MVNETEAEFLSGFSVYTDKEIIACRKKLQNLCKGTVIITLGKQGSCVFHEGSHQMIPSFQVKAVDATAAGDTYRRALAVTLGEGQSMESAVQFASAASAISVTRFGAQPSPPYRREIEAFLEGY